MNMAFLLLLLLLLTQRSYCPPLRTEIVDITETWATYKTIDGVVIDQDISQRTPNATSTIERIYGKKVGEEVDESAVEHNKRVKECQTSTGQF